MLSLINIKKKHKIIKSKKTALCNGKNDITTIIMIKTRREIAKYTSQNFNVTKFETSGKNNIFKIIYTLDFWFFCSIVPGL